MDTEKCRIKLDSPESIYFSGQTIKGEFCLKLSKRTKVRGIKYQITGKGKCKWIELLHNESLVKSNSSSERSIIYSGRECYQADEGFIFGSKTARPVELDQGEHTYEFNIKLNERLPSSITGTYGSIKYKLKFTVDKSWSFDDTYELPITVVRQKVVVVGNEPAKSVLRQVTRNIGVFGSGPISLVAELPKEYVIRDQPMQLNVSVHNQSSTHIDKLKFSIRQIICYTTLRPLIMEKYEINKIYRKETGGIQKKSERSFAYELQLPSCQPTDTDISVIIKIRYEAQVDIVLPGLYKNITLTLPFNVVVAEVGANPFETPAAYYEQANFMYYPNPNNLTLQSNSSIGSPSHSFYSENGSIYSNLSDSSASTLSPVLNADSFVRNYSGRASSASSVRSSMRSSIGFELSQNSPQHMPGLAEIDFSPNMPTFTQAHHNPSEMPFSPNLPTFTEAHHNEQHSISAYPNEPIRNTYSHPSEMPPSYEELFGTSSHNGRPSAPPMTPPDKLAL